MFQWVPNSPKALINHLTACLASTYANEVIGPLLLALVTSFVHETLRNFGCVQTNMNIFDTCFVDFAPCKVLSTEEGGERVEEKGENGKVGERGGC